MKKISVQPNQTIYDLAAQYYGNTEAVAEIAANNPGLTNDPDALRALGVAPEDAGFFFDAAIRPASTVLIDEASRLKKESVVRDIIREVTTFDL